jgi:hypothetical protein
VLRGGIRADELALRMEAEGRRVLVAQDARGPYSRALESVRSARGRQQYHWRFPSARPRKSRLHPGEIVAAPASQARKHGRCGTDQAKLNPQARKEQHAPDRDLLPSSSLRKSLLVHFATARPPASIRSGQLPPLPVYWP